VFLSSSKFFGWNCAYHYQNCNSKKIEPYIANTLCQHSIFFSVQQVIEGILWLTIPRGDYLVLQKITIYIYFFFAHILWPLWVAVAILLLEKIKTRKIIQKVLVAIGITVGFYLGYCLANYNVEAKIEEHHIDYILDYSDLMNNFLDFLICFSNDSTAIFITHKTNVGFRISNSCFLCNYANFL
jgi:hypothetical protein